MSPSVNIRVRVTRAGAKRWQVRWRAGGRESAWEVIATWDTEREAKACQRWAWGEIAQGRRPELRSRLRRPETVAELAERYGETYSTRSTAPGESSAKKRWRLVRDRLGSLGPKPAREVTGPDVQAWVLAQEGLAASSLRQYLSELRRWFEWGEINPNPAAWGQIRVPEERHEAAEDPPSFAEWSAILEALPRAHRPLFIVAEGTGLRLGELRSLTWGDIDWRGARLRVARSKGRTKGIRLVPLVPRVREVLASLAAPEDRIADRLVFTAGESALRNALARACKHAGTRHHHPHDLRHRFGSLLSLAGVDPALAQKIMGHSNIAMLGRYTHVVLDEPEDRLRELAEAVDHVYRPARLRGASVGSREDSSDDLPLFPGDSGQDGRYWARSSRGPENPIDMGETGHGYRDPSSDG